MAPCCAPSHLDCQSAAATLHAQDAPFRLTAVFSNRDAGVLMCTTRGACAFGSVLFWPGVLMRWPPSCLAGVTDLSMHEECLQLCKQYGSGCMRAAARALSYSAARAGQAQAVWRLRA